MQGYGYAAASNVTIVNRQLMVDGAVDNFSCESDGSHYYQDTDVLDRDFPLIHAMNANTIRTWGKDPVELFQKADEYGLKVMAGYWVGYDLNYEYLFNDPNGQLKKQDIVDDFVSYVNTHKNEPALLMWGLSNENNLAFCSYECPPDPSCDADIQASYYYQLMNEMADAAKTAEGATYHPYLDNSVSHHFHS